MNYKITNFDNKLRFVSSHIDDFETISFLVAVNTGSRNEQKINNGISHFIEHMAFKGTKKRSAKQIAEEFEYIGGKINAYTSREKTIYYCKILKNDIEFAIDFFADIIQNSTFEQIEMDRERKVILEEISMCEDTPDDIIYDYLIENTFSNQSLGRPIIGNRENVKRFNKNDILEYIDNQYNYSDIVISACGNLNHDELSEMVNNKFNNLSTNKIYQGDNVKYQPSFFSKNKNELNQTHILYAFNSISYNDEDYYKMQILSNILGSGMSSRLFYEIREKRSLAYSTYSFNYNFKDSGLLLIYGAVNNKNINEFLKSSANELMRLSQDITSYELEKVKNQIKSSLFMSAESSNSISQKLASNLLNFNKIIDNQEIIDNINNITIDDIKNIAKKIIINQKPSLAITGNIKDISITDYNDFTRYFSN